MDIQTILDYQSLDFEKVKINRQLAKSDEYVRYTRANEATKKSVDNVAKMSTRAAQLFAKAEEIAAQFEAASKEYDEIAGAAEGLDKSAVGRRSHPRTRTPRSQRAARARSTNSKRSLRQNSTRSAPNSANSKKRRTRSF